MTDAPWRPRQITMRALDGRDVTAAYFAHEVVAFEKMRADGVSDDEIRFMHELKGAFDATLEHEAPPRTSMMPAWDERRNTSAVRVVRTFEQHQRELLAEGTGCLSPTMCDLVGCRGLCRDRQADPDREAAEALPVQESLL